MSSPKETVERMTTAMKQVAAVLRDNSIPFMLGGGFAAWARGGRESWHDVDFMLKREDAEQALAVLEQAGFRTERPPEAWLYKVYCGPDDVLVDLIFEPSGLEIDDEALERADELDVLAMTMRVMALEDVVITKLSAMKEHAGVSYDSLLALSRATREQIDWDDVRRRAPDTPYVRAFFVLVEGLGIAPQPRQDDDSASALSSVTPLAKSG